MTSFNYRRKTPPLCLKRHPLLPPFTCIFGAFIKPQISDMAKVSIYLNFQGNTEEAFRFYKEVFGTEFSTPFMFMRDVPPQPGMQPLPEKEMNAVMHVALPILAGIEIMGTDMLESMGHKLRIGNNTTINLEPDTRAETERLFNALSKDGSDIAPLSDQFWGSYWGSCLDRFGIRWMFNCYEK
jgi:PhnB protein